MKFFGPALFCLSVSLASSNVFAQDVEQGWTGEASLTGSKTTGNTDTTDIGLGLKVENLIGLWTHKIAVQGDYGESDGITNKQRASVAYQLNRDIGDRFYVLGEGSWFSADFGAFIQGWYGGAGIGYHAVQSDAVQWSVETGLGYRWQKAQTPTMPHAITFGRVQEEIALSAGSDFDWAFNDNVSFANDTELLSSDSDTYIWNESSLTADLMGNLAARVSFRVDHHTTVPIGRENTDTVTRVGIVYTLD